MKKRIALMLCVLLIVSAAGLNGCSKESLAAIGGITGLETAGRILSDIEGVTDREKALVLAHTLALERERAEAASEVEKARLDAEIERSKFAEAGWTKANEATVVVSDQLEAAEGVNFKNPEESLPYLLTAGMAIYGLLTGRKLGKTRNNMNALAAKSEPRIGEAIHKVANGG